jgi:transketolase
MAVGMAIAERHLNAVYGDDLVDHRTFVIAGDGCLMEGVNHEAIGLAGHLKLGRLIVLWDDNHITIDGSTDLSRNEDVVARHRAAQWHTCECDGLNADDVSRAIQEAIADPRPSLIRCKTIIGFGAPNKQGTAATHGAALGPDEVEAARQGLGLDPEPFTVPDEVLTAWRTAGKRGSVDHALWKERLDTNDRKDEFLARLNGKVGDAWLRPYLDRLFKAGVKPVATRKASEMALEAINAAIPATIGGSADLTGSNNTKTKATGPLTAADFAGRYVYYGIREFGMAAAMNGMALHGGVIPYGGTFLIFSDYARNAIRMSALQRARAIYVLTHDSIGLGEDGPTHQPVEQVMSLRMIPGLNVFRPADAMETAECWELALQAKDRPSALILTRQNLPAVRSDTEMKSARGAYRLKAATAARKVVLLATGSEVELALKVAADIEGKGIGADVVSMPSWELFDAQPAAYRADLLAADALKVSIEAGVTLGWQKYVGDGITIGLDRFGASAPAEVLFEHFGFSVDKIVPQITARLG